MTDTKKDEAMMTTLLPCPFCGSKAEFWKGQVMFEDYEVHCTKCDIVGPNCDGNDPNANMEAAAKHWNYRTPSHPGKAWSDAELREVLAEESSKAGFSDNSARILYGEWERLCPDEHRVLLAAMRRVASPPAAGVQEAARELVGWMIPLVNKHVGQRQCSFCHEVFDGWPMVHTKVGGKPCPVGTLSDALNAENALRAATQQPEGVGISSLAQRDKSSASESTKDMDLAHDNTKEHSNSNAGAYARREDI